MKIDSIRDVVKILNTVRSSAILNSVLSKEDDNKLLLSNSSEMLANASDEFIDMIVCLEMSIGCFVTDENTSIDQFAKNELAKHGYTVKRATGEYNTDYMLICNRFTLLFNA